MPRRDLRGSCDAGRRLDWQWLILASLRMAMAWQIIEGYAQLRHSNECKAGEERSNASLSSGNESRSNEQKSKKEWIA